MLSALRRYVDDPIATWRTGSPQSQALTLLALLVGVCLCFVLSVLAYDVMPIGAYYIWLLLGMLLLRYWPLVALSVVIWTAAITAVLFEPPVTLPKITSVHHPAGLPLAGPLLLQPAAERPAGPGQRGDADRPARSPPVAGHHPTAARGLALAVVDGGGEWGRVRRRLHRRQAPQRGTAPRADPGRRLRQGRRSRVAGAAVRRCPGWADRRPASSRAVRGGQRLPPAPGVRRDLRHGRARPASTSRPATTSSPARAIRPRSCGRAPMATWAIDEARGPALGIMRAAGAAP